MKAAVWQRGVYPLFLNENDVDRVERGCAVQ